jgi:hypothetical protein
MIKEVNPILNLSRQRDDGNRGLIPLLIKKRDIPLVLTRHPLF